MRGTAAFERVAERLCDSRHLNSRFMREFQAELVDAGRPPLVEMCARFLRLGAEDGISAAYVGHHRMRAASRVAQRHTVFLAGAAAVAIAGAGREKPAEYAVLHVEDRQVLVGHYLDGPGARAARQFSHLGGVQVMRGREARKTQPQKLGGRDYI